MLEIIVSVVVNFFTLSGIFVFWKLFGSVRIRTPSSEVRSIKTGERSTHSNLGLATLGMGGFFVFPILLVGVRWSEFGKTIDTNGYLYLLGFLLTGIVSYLYFVRALRGGNR